jgi:hypothetical protein
MKPIKPIRKPKASGEGYPWTTVLQWVNLAMLIVVLFYLIFPLAKTAGLMGSIPLAHEPNRVYSSIQVGEATMQYSYLNFDDCEKFRNEFIAKSMTVTPCRLGSELDSTK